MQAWAKRYAIVFGLGFVIFAYAVGVGSAIGQPLTQDAALLSLRYLGGGLMLSGMTLWIVRARIEGKRPGLNPMFGLLLAFSAILLVIGTIVGIASGDVFSIGLQAGLVTAAAALAIGVLAMLIAPPEPRPAYDYPWMNPAFDPDTDAYAAGMVVPNAGYGPEDLTRIAGIDEEVAAALHKAGLEHFSQLANTSPEALRDILKEAGHATPDPTTWPDQALLAANRDWDALQQFQEQAAAQQATA